MTREECMVINEEIKFNEREFLRFVIQLLLQTEDFATALLEERFTVNGLTGCMELTKQIETYKNSYVEEETSLNKESDYNQIKHTLDEAMDISVCYGIIKQLLPAFNKEIKDIGAKRHREKVR